MTEVAAIKNLRSLCVLSVLSGESFGLDRIDRIHWIARLVGHRRAAESSQSCSSCLKLRLPGRPAGHRGRRRGARRWGRDGRQDGANVRNSAAPGSRGPAGGCRGLGRGVGVRAFRGARLARGIGGRGTFVVMRDWMDTTRSLPGGRWSLEQVAALRRVWRVPHLVRFSGKVCEGGDGITPCPSGQGVMPCSKPPGGRIRVVSLNTPYTTTGDLRWFTTLGSTST